MSRSPLFVSLAFSALLAINALAQTVVLTPNTTNVSSTGGTVSFTASITYSSTPAVLAFSATLPAGWAYLSGTNEPQVHPSPGNTGELGWAYTSGVPLSPATFVFDATYPAGLTGLQPITTQTVTRTAVEAPPVTTPGPTVTISAPSTSFTWVGNAIAQTGNWTDPALWNPTGTVPNNTGLSTYAAQINLGTVTIPTATDITINSLFLLGGTINGGGTLSLAGTDSSWTAGALSNLKSLTIAPGAQLTASTNNAHNFGGTAVINQGTFRWVDGGTLSSGTNVTFTNALGGTFTDASTAGNDRVITNGFGDTFAFTNAGTYQKTVSGSTTRIEVPFTNTGNILLDAGTLRFTSTFTQTSGLLRLASGTTAVFDNALLFPAGSLIGSGTLTGNVTHGAATGPTATLSPGDKLGQLTIQGNLTLLNTSQFLVDLGGTTQGVSYDFLSVSGSVTFGGTLTLNFVNNFGTTVSPTTTFTVLTANSLTGVFNNAANGTRLATLDGSGSFLVNFSANNLTLSGYQVTPIPEPSTWALMIAGLGVIAVSAWRRRK